MDGEVLKARLPQVRGRLEANYPLADLTWFRVGGPAEVLYTPADEADLAAFMSGLPEDVPYLRHWRRFETCWYATAACLVLSSASDVGLLM